MKKNIDRLPENILSNLRENFTDEQINVMIPDRIFKEFLEYEGIIGYTRMIREAYESIFNKDDEKKDEKKDEWCCYVLSKEEIEKVMIDIFNDSSTEEIQKIGIFESEDKKEEFIKDVVDRFKKCLHSSFDDWENIISSCIIEVSKDWKSKENN